MGRSTDACVLRRGWPVAQPQWRLRTRAAVAAAVAAACNNCPDHGVWARLCDRKTNTLHRMCSLLINSLIIQLAFQSVTHMFNS